MYNFLTLSEFEAVRYTSACIANDEAKRTLLPLRHILANKSNFLMINIELLYLLRGTKGGDWHPLQKILHQSNRNVFQPQFGHRLNLLHRDTLLWFFDP